MLRLSYPRRLIEVDLPIGRISSHSRREKSSGPLATLHTWWARRPLSACRSVMLASLWPDPESLSEGQWGREVAPSVFLDAARRELSLLARSASRLSVERRISPVTASFLSMVQKDLRLLDSPVQIRTGLLHFIGDYANPDAANDDVFVGAAARLTKAAHECLTGDRQGRPLVIDPFAGGGSIPLEAVRCGADAFASDLNPIPVLLNRIVIEYVPRFGQDLANEVERLSKVIGDSVRSTLSRHFPDESMEDGRSVAIAYLWARTILSEAPDQGDLPVEVPLIRSLWLTKKSNQRRALRWKRDARGQMETTVVEVAYEVNGAQVTRRVRRPLLEVFQPSTEAEVERGTVVRGSATCPVTGFTTKVDRVRGQLASRKGGGRDARLLAVVYAKDNTPGRFFRIPGDLDIRAAWVRADDVIGNGAVPAAQDVRQDFPSESLPKPADGRGSTLGIGVVGYGMSSFGDLYSRRQRLLLSELSRLVREIRPLIRRDRASGSQTDGATDRYNALPWADATVNNKRMTAEQSSTVDIDEGFSDAVQSILACAVDRMAEHHSTLCRWNPSGQKMQASFGRQIIPMTWDFCEANPFGGSVGSWDNIVDCVLRPFNTCRSIQGTGQVQQASADRQILPDDAASVVFTDPPYYDAVPYSDLSDYFFVWLKRMLPSRLLGAAHDGLTPKTDECIVDEGKGKGHAFFESMMTRVMHECWHVVKHDGIGIVVFAHKTTSGWEAQLRGIIDAGWTVTASWPIDTEMGTRLRAMDSAALGSSVHLVLRPREGMKLVRGGSPCCEVRQGERETVGEWREVLGELPPRLAEWMPRLASEGVVGADAIFACLGPALEIFSRYSRVEKASGEAVALREYLEHVWAAVSSEALSMIFKDADAAGLEPDARLTAMWLWTLGGGKPQAKSEGEDGEETESDDEEETTSKKSGKVAGFVLEFDAARKIAQGLGIHLEKSESIVEVKGESARLLPVSERTRHLFGKDAEEDSAKTRKAKKKAKQGSLFEELDAIEAEAASTGGRFGGLEGTKPGATVLDKVHQSMILFAAGRGEALKRFLVEDGVGKNGRYWKLAQSLSALYPTGTDEKRWVDGVLARKKGLGF